MTEVQALALALVKKRKRVWGKLVWSKIKSGQHKLLGGFNPNREFCKLENKSLLTSTIEQPGTRHEHRVYTITPEGKKAIRKFQKHLEEVQADLSGKGEFQ